jgi:dTDP-glucose pyrophosphorylase
MQAVILAAGKGSRLAPITDSRSKGMLPILGKPILERILEGLVCSGLREFILVISPEDRAIRDYFQDESTLEVNIQFVEQDRRLGTADALKQAAPYINEDFVLSACDNIVPEGEMQRFITDWSQHPDTQGLLSLERIPLQDSVKTGIVTLEEDRVTGIVEKPSPDEAPSNISSTPLYVFSTRILNYLHQVSISPRGEYELQDAIQMMIDDGHAMRGLFLQNRLTLTTDEDLLAINLHFLKHEAEGFQNEALQIGQRTLIVEPVCIEQEVVIGSNCTIGSGVYIEKNACIGDWVEMENVVVLQGAVISDKSTFRHQVVMSAD